MVIQSYNTCLRLWITLYIFLSTQGVHEYLSSASSPQGGAPQQNALAATGLQILVDGNVPEGEGCTVLHAAAAERWNWHFKRRCSSASRACNSLWMRRCAWKCEMHGSACCNCWSYKLALQKVLRFTKLGLQFLMDEKVCLELWIARFCMLQLLKLKMVLQKALRFTNSGLQFLVDE